MNNIGNKNNNSKSKIDQDIFEFFLRELGVKKINSNDDIFDIVNEKKTIGRLIQTLNARLKIRLSIDHLKRARRIEDIIELVKNLYLDNENIPRLSVIQPAPRKKYYPLSSAQNRMWILYKLMPNSPYYNEYGVYKIYTRVSRKVLGKALDILIERHGILRTKYCDLKNGPMQTVLPKLNNQLKYYDISKFSQNERRGKKRKIFRNKINTSFRLDREMAYRFVLIKEGIELYTFFYVMHHISNDGQTGKILMRELKQAYSELIRDKKVRFPILKLQYNDYAAWERSKNYQTLASEQEKYWIQKLSGALPVINLPFDRPPTFIQTHRGANKTIYIKDNLKRLIQKECTEKNITMYMYLLSIFYILLNKITGQNDIIIGSPVTNRSHKDIENVMGCFINMMPLRIRVEKDMTFSGFLKRIKYELFQSLNNKEFSFDQLIDLVKPERNMSREPLFDVLFHFEPHVNNKLDNNHNALKMSPIPHERTTAQYFMSLLGKEEKNKIILTLNYATDIFNADTINNFLKYLVNLIENAVHKPKQKITKLDILDKEERIGLVRKSKGPIRDYPGYYSIHELFEEQARTTPDNIAIKHNNKIISYRELKEKASSAAGYLIEKHGIKPGDCIGLMFEKSPEAIIAMLAVLKTGAAYIPININYPDKRIEFIIYDTKAKILLSHQLLSTRTGKLKGRIVNVEDILRAPQTTAKKAYPRVKTINPACIFYTSGSTGQPKGVIQTHQGIINNIFTKIEYLKINSSDLICQNLNYGFAASSWQIYTPLFLGSKTIIGSMEIVNAPDILLRHIAEDNISILELTPSYFKGFIDLVREGGMENEIKKIKTIILTGEELPVSTINDFFKISNTRLINAYGPTEYTDDALYCKLKPDKKYVRLPLGNPALNTEVYVLNKNMDLTPPTCIGEIYISGDGLALGYLGLKNETKKVFLRHPFKRDRKIYKTGDMAKVGTDKELYFKGRSDRQVQIRGNRVELDEIAAALKTHPKLKDVFIEYGVFGKGNIEKSIIAYYTRKPRSRVKLEELKFHIITTLPSYMIPAYFMELKEFPLNVNGKFDRTKLPLPEEKDLLKAEFSSPKTEIEKKLAGVWRKVLGVKKISRNDNFFDLGGHSVDLVLVHKQIDIIFSKKISLASMFSYPTICQLADYLTKSDEYHQIFKANKINIKSKITDLLDQVRDKKISLEEAANLVDEIK